MVAIQGKMFILVHVDRNRELVGDISSRLVADYGVPVSIVDDIQKFCPKCSGDGKQDIVPFTAPSTSTSEENHEIRVLSPIRLKTTGQSLQRPVQTSSATHSSQPRIATLLPLKHVATPPSKPTPIPLKVVLAPPHQKPITVHRAPQVAPQKSLPKMLNGLQQSTSKMSNGPASQQKREQPRNGTPEKMVPEKKSRFEEHLPKIVSKIEPTIKLEDIEFNNEDIPGGGESMDESGDLATILAKLQNQACDFSSIGTGTGNSSDDNASISSNMYDDDDVPFNPDILTNFITSQQATDFFGHTSLDSLKETKSDGKPVMVTTHRAVPPMLTVNGKTRRGRIVYSAHELNILEEYYEKDPNACADPKKRETMCRMLSIDYHRLKVWFQNRRRKDKVRSQEDASNTSNSHSPESIAEVL